jgi:hypothetical protein
VSCADSMQSVAPPARLPIPPNRSASGNDVLAQTLIYHNVSGQECRGSLSPLLDLISVNLSSIRRRTKGRTLVTTHDYTRNL